VSILKKGLITILLVLAVSGTVWGEGDGMVAYWSFDEGEGTIVKDLVGENHGLLKTDKDGEIPIWTRGKLGTALMFISESMGYVEVPGHSSIKPQEALTVMAWVKLASSSGRHEIVCNKTDTSRAGYRLFQKWSELVFEISDGTEHYTLSARTLPIGVWCHVAGTFDGNVMKVYINGDQVGKMELPSQKKIAPNTQPVLIGNYLGRKNAYPFDGVIDEVRIFNRALSSEEVGEYSL
jgi:hypothetical protein